MTSHARLLYYLSFVYESMVSRDKTVPSSYRDTITILNVVNRAYCAQGKRKRQKMLFQDETMN
jgi:hypothetical protein